MRHIFPARFPVAMTEFFILKAIPIRVGYLHGRVGGVQREITEKGFVFLIFHEIHGLVGQVIDDESFALNCDAVAFEWGTEVISPMARAKAVEFIKSPGIGVVGSLHAVVPFAESSGGVARFFEHLGYGCFVSVQSLSSGGSAVNASSRVVSAGQEFSTCWRADRTDVEPVEPDSIAG